MNQWWLMAFIGWSLGLFGAGAYYEHRSDLATFEAGQVKAERAARDQEHNAINITSEVDHDYQNKKAAIDAGWNALIDGLQPDGPGLRGFSHPAGKPDAPACRDPVPAKIKRARAALMKSCDEQTQELVDLQAWVKRQQKAANPGR